MYIENIVIGQPLCNEKLLFSLDEEDWVINEKQKTYYTQERFLPRILVELGIYPSVSEIRRNRRDLMIGLDKVGFYDGLKVAKRHWLWIVVGE